MSTTRPERRSTLSRQAEASRKAFGTRLRDLRRDAGLKGVELAEQLECHSAQISRIEHGRQNPTEGQIRAWAIACGQARQIPELIAVHREIEQMWVEWKRELRAGQKRIQARGTPEYARTKLLRAYEPIIVPGILQVRGYVLEVMGANARLFDLPSDELEEAANARLERQHLLTEGPGRFSFVIEAGALNAWMGDAEVMHEQFDFLVRATRLPKVALGIIPPRQRVLFGGEGFYIFDDRLARNDLWAGSIRATRAEEVGFYVKVFEMLRSMAVYDQAARNLIEAARSELPQRRAKS
ncbi:helix-turn-helix domain-containing protein [Actinomadura sp. 6N118]|uniref:helix-turn-helix domain-containing protein n=1 Tax=Actinomadura sp. 6N118 TaxID=3375151 RepID=UPI0037B00435